MNEVLFLRPTLSHSCSIEHSNSMIETERLLLQNGISSTWVSIGGDPYLAKVRNKLATKAFFEFSYVENIFWIDDDVSWQAAAVLKFLKRPEPIVVGVYPKKSDKLDFPVTLIADVKTGKPIEKDGLLMAEMAPTGFMRWKREVLDYMADVRPMYLDCIDGKWQSFIESFRTGVLFDDKKWYGEDAAFCREWLETGGEIWVDPNIQFSHRGSNRWTACLADHLEGFKVPDVGR